MKTKEVIRQLQEADPTGEVEVCVNNIDIHHITPEPAYWDGRLEVLKRDENLKCYNIIGGEFVTEGTKIVIIPLSIHSALFNDPNMPISFERCDSCMDCEHIKEQIEKERKKIREMHARIGKN